MNVLFVAPKSKNMFGDSIDLSDGVEGSAGHPHLGLASLTSFLKAHDHRVEVYDHQITNCRTTLKKLIDNFKPDLIGVTAYSYSYLYVREMIDLLKSISPTQLVVGGPHVSATNAEIVQSSPADFAVMAEGEFVLLDLLAALERGDSDLSAIEGLIWRDGDRIAVNAPRPFIKDVDALPYPDYDAFPLEKYQCYQERLLPVISSRGCPYQCTFCSVKLSMGRLFRKRSAESFVDELEHWVAKGWERFEFDDDCYTVDMKRVTKISNLIIERGLKIRYDIYNGIRVDRVSPELLHGLKASGCSLVSFGLEAANQQVLDNIRKQVTLDQVRDPVKWTKEAGLQCSVNFILGHQGETLATARESIAFARTLPTDFVNFYNLVPYPGTESFTWVKQNGRFLVPEDEYLQNISYRDNEPIFETNEFTAQERRIAIKEGFKLYELKVLQFRLGKTLGYLIYLAMRFEPLARFARTKAMNSTGFIHILYKFLSRKSHT